MRNPKVRTIDVFGSGIDDGLGHLGERPGSGDGERKTSMTRQIAFEPLPASVLFALVGVLAVIADQRRMPIGEAVDAGSPNVEAAYRPP